MSDETIKLPASTPEAVNHPKHYNSHPSGVECIDVIEHMTFNVGSAVKYCWRAGLKVEQGRFPRTWTLFSDAFERRSK